MSKRLSPDAKDAIAKEVRNETDKVLNRKFKEIEKNIIKKVSKNITGYLLQECGEKIVENSRKKYKKKVRDSIVCILEGYKDLKDFVENANKQNYRAKIDYKINQILRTDEFLYARTRCSTNKGE